jgi:hypothetical protein
MQFMWFLKLEDIKMSQDFIILCPSCHSNTEKIKTLVRERIGCAANCSGKMIEKIVCYKCLKCGKVVRA